LQFKAAALPFRTAVLALLYLFDPLGPIRFSLALLGIMAWLGVVKPALSWGISLAHAQVVPGQKT
jgi:hypothetical protein